MGDLPLRNFEEPTGRPKSLRSFYAHTALAAASNQADHDCTIMIFLVGVKLSCNLFLLRCAKLTSRTAQHV